MTLYRERRKGGQGHKRRPNTAIRLWAERQYHRLYLCGSRCTYNADDVASMVRGLREMDRMNRIAERNYL